MGHRRHRIQVKQYQRDAISKFHTSRSYIGQMAWSLQQINFKEEKQFSKGGPGTYK